MTTTPQNTTATDNPSTAANEYATLGSAMRASTGAFMATGFFSFFINLLMLTGPLFMLQIYDRVLASRSVPTLMLLFLLVVGLFAFLGFLEFIRSRILTRVGGNIFQRIHKRVFDAVMHLSLLTGGSSNSTKPLQDLTTLQQYISGPGPSTFFDAPWVPIYLLVIFAFHWWLGVLATFAAIVLFIIALLNDIRARKPTAKASIEAGAGNQYADAGRRNAEVLTALGMQSAIRDRWQDKQIKALIHQTSARDRASTLTSISKALRLLFQSAMLAVGALLTIQQEITPGTMIAASIILGRALQPIEQAIAHWRGFVQARQSYRSLAKLLKEITPDKEKMTLPRPTGRLDVRGLHVAAPMTRTIILKNINFSIEPGKILGIIGQSGGGKSTLARALVGVWPPAGGDVRIDDATHDQWNREDLGRYLGYLPQDVELFGGKINENIARYQKGFDEKDVIRAAELAGVDKLIKLRGGYDTEIGPMGSSLSSGQKQRVALARAMYLDPPLVVLDEPNSNLDQLGDDALLAALIAMRDNGQTVVIVSHRRAILNITDYILELGEGTQIDFGPREEIIPRIIARNKAANGQPPSPAGQSGTPVAAAQAAQPNGSPAGSQTDLSSSQVKMTVGTPQWAAGQSALSGITQNNNNGSQQTDTAPGEPKS